MEPFVRERFDLVFVAGFAGVVAGAGVDGACNSRRLIMNIRKQKIRFRVEKLGEFVAGATRGEGSQLPGWSVSFGDVDDFGFVCRVGVDGVEVEDGEVVDLIVDFLGDGGLDEECEGFAFVGAGRGGEAWWGYVGVGDAGLLVGGSWCGHCCCGS